MLPNALRHAQLVNLEHANQVIARGGGLDHRLRRKHRSEAPHIRTLLDLGWTAAEAIELVRTQRGLTEDGFQALSNERFVEWLLVEEAGGSQ